jgi:RNA polymerase primary sigma factor
MKKTTYTDHDDILRSYVAQIRKIPLLSFEEELELSQLIQQGNETARQRLIEANLRLVVKVARSYTAQDVSLMDIIQEGNLGLMHAAEKYSHLKNVRFSTYACWWIRQSISRFLVNRRRAIRLPHRKEEVLRKVQKVYHTLSQTLMRQPRLEEIANEVGVSQEEIELVLNMTNGFVSLEMDNGNEEYSNIMMDVYGDYTYSPEQELIRQSSRDATLKALKTLKAKERRILMYRYQLNGGERHTLKSIGDKMGLSPETVRQIEIRALRKMRDHAKDLEAYCMEAR